MISARELALHSATNRDDWGRLIVADGDREKVGHEPDALLVGDAEVALGLELRDRVDADVLFVGEVVCG